MSRTREPEDLSRRELLSLARRLSGGSRNIPDDRAALVGYVRRRLDSLDGGDTGEGRGRFRRPIDPPASIHETEGVSWEEIRES